MKNFFAPGLPRLLSILCMVGVFLFLAPRPAAAQNILFNGDIFDDECFDATGEGGCDVEGVADITAFTNASTIDTFVGTYINNYDLLDEGYYAYVQGFLYDQSGQVSDGKEGFDDGIGEAEAYMEDSIAYSSHGYVLDDVYELDAYNDLVDDFDDDYPIGASIALAPIGAPTILGINPIYGYVGTSGEVVIQGVDLLDPFFGTVSASVSTGTGMTVTPESFSGDPFGTEYLGVAYSATQCASTGSRFIAIATQFGSDTGDQGFTLGDPTPVITSVTPGAWQAGTANLAITIQGMGFGTNPTVSVSGTGVTLVSVGAVSDTQISATVSIASSAPNQTALVQVQSNGYCGSGFQPANGNPSFGTYGVPVQATLAPVPQIQLYGQNITAAQSVAVGQQMALRAVVTLPQGVSIASQQWSTPQGSAVGGYTNLSGHTPCLPASNCPTPDSTGGTVLALPGNMGDTSSNCATPNAPTYYSCFTFYWADSGTQRQLTYTYTTSGGQSNSASVTFNVDGPSGVSIGAPSGSQIQTAVDIFAPPVNIYDTEYPFLGDGNGNNIAGINLLATSSHLPAGGKYQWVQLLTKFTVKLVCGSGPKTPVSIVGQPQLDNTYPYSAVTTTTVINDGANDSPGIVLDDLKGEEAISFAATMYLMWVPPALNGCPNGSSCTIPVPLGSFPWTMWGDAINSEAVSFSVDDNDPYATWIKNATSPADSNGGFVKGGSYPIWTAKFSNGSFVCQ